MDTWLQEFPQTHFGFTPLVESFDRSCLEALQAIPDDRLLLETDSPYFRMAGRRWTTPALIGMVGAAVARKRGQTWEHTLQIYLANTRRLYGLGQ